MHGRRNTACTSATTRLAAAGKDQRKIITAVARELLGFIWAIGIKAETAARQRMQPDEKAKAKAKTFQRMKKQKQLNDEQRHPIRAQSQQQPEQARRRILVCPMRQAQPDSR